MKVRSSSSSPHRTITVKLMPSASSWFVWIVVAVLVVVIVVLVVGVVAAMWRLFLRDKPEGIAMDNDCPIEKRQIVTLEQRVKSLLHDAILINHYIDQATAAARRTTTIKSCSGSALEHQSNGDEEQSPGMCIGTITTTTTTTTALHDDTPKHSTGTSSPSSLSSSSIPPIIIEQVDEQTKPQLIGRLSRRLDEFDRRVRRLVSDIEQIHVPWGGGVVVGGGTITIRNSPWYTRDLLLKYYTACMELRQQPETTLTSAAIEEDDDDDDGWATNVHFPRTKCLHSKKKHLGGCRIEESILYSLQWRQAYQPWRVTPSMIKENQVGFVYANGVTTPNRNHHDSAVTPTSHITTNKNNDDDQLQSHGIVWYRPGRLTSSYQDPLSYYRCVFHSIDRAIAPTGTFVAVVDAANVTWHKVPNLQYWARQTIAMLKDHYPHRLGYILILNMSPMAELVLQIVRPLLPIRVRGLLRFVKTKSELESFLGKQVIENEERYEFQVDQYYEPARFHWSDQEGEQYLKFITAVA